MNEKFVKIRTVDNEQKIFEGYFEKYSIKYKFFQFAENMMEDQDYKDD